MSAQVGRRVSRVAAGKNNWAVAVAAAKGKGVLLPSAPHWLNPPPRPRPILPCSSSASTACSPTARRPLHPLVAPPWWHSMWRCVPFSCLGGRGFGASALGRKPFPAAHSRASPIKRRAPSPPRPLSQGIHPTDLSTILDQSGVAVRSGHLCAQASVGWGWGEGGQPGWTRCDGRRCLPAYGLSRIHPSIFTVVHVHSNPPHPSTHKHPPAHPHHPLCTAPAPPLWRVLQPARLTLLLQHQSRDRRVCGGPQGEHRVLPLSQQRWA